MATQGTLPFAAEEYDDRLAGLRDIMELHELDAVVLTSMHNVAYYSGFLYCTLRAALCLRGDEDRMRDDQRRDRRGPAVAAQPSATTSPIPTGRATTCGGRWPRSPATGKAIGCEADHLTMERAEKLNTFLKPKRGMDIAPATMQQRMMKSPAEIALIKHGANVADVGGYAIREAIAVGATRA